MIHEAFVYKWTNLTTGSFYIGYHKGSQDDGYVCSSKSIRFWSDFHNPTFMWKRDVLFQGTQEECVTEELRLLNECNLHDDKVYNNSKGGGIVFTREIREKMSSIKRGKKKGPISEETRQRMSNAKKGKVYSDETRAKMSLAKHGVSPWNLGKTFSLESREKMRAAKVGITWTVEDIEKRAASNRGKKRQLVNCPYCNAQGGRPAMLRWHFENCKQRA